MTFLEGSTLNSEADVDVGTMEAPYPDLCYRSCRLDVEKDQDILAFHRLVVVSGASIVCCIVVHALLRK